MDLCYFYNNIEDSDIKIGLNNGEFIYCHKIILKISCDMFLKMLTHKMRETETNIIRFPEHADISITTIIKYFYNYQDMNYSKLKLYEWYEIFEFANYLMLEQLVENLEKQIERYIHPNQVLWLATELKNDNLIKKGIKLIIRDHNSYKEQDYEILKTINIENYNKIRNMWFETHLSHFVLFKMDCYYCYYNNNDNLSKFIENIDIEEFDISQLFECKNLPIVPDNKIIMKLFDTIIQLV